MTPTVPTLAAQLTKIVVTLAATVAMLVGMGAYALWAFNPVGDERECSPGEFLARSESGGKACFDNGEELPPHLHPHPRGNPRIN
jgi:hypothetical protein